MLSFGLLAIAIVADSPCHHAMVQYCNATAGKGAPCVACENAHRSKLTAAGCVDWKNPTSKLARFCGQPTPGPPHPHPVTPDCPNGPTQPCQEPATPVIDSGYTSSNVFWPGEQDAAGTVYTCTYCPMVTLVNETKLLAIGSCTPSGCDGCNGIHLSHPEGEREDGRTAAGSACSAGCIKHSDDGGRSWSKIRKFTNFGPGGMINYDRVQKMVLLQFPDSHGEFAPHPGAVLQIVSADFGLTWSTPIDISTMLGPLFSPGKACGSAQPMCLAVGPGHGIQLAANNPHHPNRLIFGGHHGAYQYDMMWYSDDHGKTYHPSLDASGSGNPAQIMGQDEVALAETPDGGVIASMRNEDYHKGYPGNVSCDCRGVSRSADGGSTFGASVPDPVLIGPVCQATMLSVKTGSGRLLFHANPGHGTDKESKSPPNGRASGTVRRSSDGGVTWESSVVLNGRSAYSYSCLTAVPEPGFVGVAFETVLPGSAIKADASANNIIFTLVPMNLSHV